MPLGPYERKQIKAMNDEITNLRQQLAESEARVAELGIMSAASNYNYLI